MPGVSSPGKADSISLEIRKILFLELIDKLFEKFEIFERFAADAGPAEFAGLVDEDGSVKFHVLEVIPSEKAAGVFVVGIAEEADPLIGCIAKEGLILGWGIGADGKDLSVAIAERGGLCIEVTELLEAMRAFAAEVENEDHVMACIGGKHDGFAFGVQSI